MPAVAAAVATAWWLKGRIEANAARSARLAAEAAAAQAKLDRERLAYIEPRDFWREDELRAFDGSNGEEGPILLGADGLVFNVGTARHFYAPGAAYHVLAGRDASRLLAKNTLEEDEGEDSASAPLNIAERAVLAAWVMSFRAKYPVVGELAAADRIDESPSGIGRSDASDATHRPPRTEAGQAAGVDSTTSLL